MSEPNPARATQEWTELEGAFDRVRVAMIRRVFETKMNQGDERERLYLSVQVLDAVKADMLNHIATGTIEAYEAAIRDERETAS